jgi:predicted RecB family nuclease
VGGGVSRAVTAHGREIVEPGDAAATEEALRRGADVVYQAVLSDGRWLGKADFVERQQDGSYEVVDTKLARHARPAHILQLCFYSEQVARITHPAPRAMHAVPGIGEREGFGPL